VFRYRTATGQDDAALNDDIKRIIEEEAPKYLLDHADHQGIGPSGQQVVRLRFKRKLQLRAIIDDSPAAVVTAISKLEREHSVLRVELVVPPFRSSSDERQFTALINVYYNR
jgi:ABC-type phosphate transport system auxiliary subunit